MARTSPKSMQRDIDSFVSVLYQVLWKLHREFSFVFVFVFFFFLIIFTSQF